MRRTLLMLLALSACGAPPPPCADLTLVDMAPAAAVDLAPIVPTCLPCRTSLPALNCAPTVCVKQGGELCCLPTG